MDRETIMMIATIVAVAGVIFLFREMNKAKQDVENLKMFSYNLASSQALTQQPEEEKPREEKPREEKVEE